MAFDSELTGKQVVREGKGQQNLNLWQLGQGPPYIGRAFPQTINFIIKQK